MPYISGSVNPELSWDGFAQPSQDMNSWEPDPNSIPVAGGFPDHRFTRSPTSTSVGSWPAPVIRASGLPRAFAPSRANDENDSSSQELKISESSPSIVSTPSTVESSKGTMETLSVNPSLRSWSATTSVLGTAERSDKSTASHPENEQGRPVSHLTTRSIPPHLRKRELANRANAVSTTSIYEPSAEAGYKAYSSEDVKSSSSPSFKSEAIRGATSEEEQDIEKALTESLIEKVLSDDHKRYLNTKLIRVMEDDLDEPVRTTPDQLREMSGDKFKSHFEETKAKHKIAWKAKFMHGIGGTDLEPSLAVFQERDRTHFGKHNGSSEARY